MTCNVIWVFHCRLGWEVIWTYFLALYRKEKYNYQIYWCSSYSVSHPSSTEALNVWNNMRMCWIFGGFGPMVGHNRTIDDNKRHGAFCIIHRLNYSLIYLENNNVNKWSKLHNITDYNPIKWYQLQYNCLSRKQIELEAPKHRYINAVVTTFSKKWERISCSWTHILTAQSQTVLDRFKVADGSSPAMPQCGISWSRNFCTSCVHCLTFGVWRNLIPTTAINGHVPPRSNTSARVHLPVMNKSFGRRAAERRLNQRDTIGLRYLQRPFNDRVTGQSITPVFGVVSGLATRAARSEANASLLAHGKQSRSGEREAAVAGAPAASKHTSDR